jgi:hypothetical protein
MKSSDMQSMLSDLGVLSARTESAEHRILKRAQEGHDRISKKIEALRPKTMLSDENDALYRQLVKRRGELAMVISRSREALKKS